MGAEQQKQSKQISTLNTNTQRATEKQPGEAGRSYFHHIINKGNLYYRPKSNKTQSKLNKTLPRRRNRKSNIQGGFVLIHGLAYPFTMINKPMMERNISD